MFRHAAWVLASVLVAGGAGNAATPAGPIGQWDFDETQGDRAADASGNGFHGAARNVTWVRTGAGGAARFAGENSFVDCGTAVAERIGTTLSLEAWVNPRTTPAGEAGIAGTGYGGFLLTQYTDNALWWYIASGTNQLRATVENGVWHHVVGTFDGETLALFVDGRERARRPTRFPGPAKGSPFLIGRVGAQVDAEDPNYARTGFFQGMVDAVRLYDRALTPAEVAEHFRAEAGRYGFDTTWFRRVRPTLFHYPARDEAVVALDYRGLLPLADGARFTVELAPEGAPARRVTIPAHSSGLGEARLSLAGVGGPGPHPITVTGEPEGLCPRESLALTHPRPRDPLPAPAERTVPPLPPVPGPAAFEVEILPRGALALTAGGERYEVVSRFSWPHGGFNALAGTEPGDGAEPAWAPAMRRGPAPGEISVAAHGARYALARRVLVRPDHVLVRDTITNTSPEDLGLLVYHALDTRGKAFERRFAGGYEGMARRREDPCPSAFVGRAGLGIGILPLDDLFVIQAEVDVNPDSAGIGTEQLALAPGSEYTLEWAVYINASGDYYDFINAVRRNEGRIGTVDGGLAFITRSPFDRRTIPEEDWMALRCIRYGVIHCLSGVADDPQLSVEGIEFMDFPREMALLREQLAELRRRYPQHRFMFHVAHSLYLTDKPDRFGDSLVVGPDGKPCVWADDGRYISKERQAEGWRWYILYPAPGNSFHDALMRSADVMMEDLGAQGVFMDGFFWGYVSRWTYNTWDGFSADLDTSTHTIARKKASVLCLSQPSLIQFARRIRDKGGTVVANNSVITRSIAAETYLIHDKELAAGPHLHLAPNATALTDCMNLTSERDVYRDMLAKLRWGMLFLYYQEGVLTYPSLASKEFPTTFEEIREGMVIGPERTVTMKPGIYGRPGSRNVPAVHHFDARGALTGRMFVTTVDRDGARTELPLSEDESAVLENVGLTIEAAAPVNAAVLEYSPRRVRVAVNGAGEAALVFSPIATVAGGAMPITPGAEYGVRIGPQSFRAAAGPTSLTIRVALAGEQELVVEAP